MRNFLAFSLMLVGPLLVWLIYAHFFRDFDADREWREAVTLGIAMVAGSIGVLILDSPFSRWPIFTKLIAFAAYGTVLAFAMPWIGLVAICTTGDCL
ncbi:hypothetical protein [Pelagerythrobacter aerophilus]|uniref:Uncharacterized protein n=1 Tax=Pelagerythrobacter aerophilus TaxID=2306995 RepID=A0A418ND79_9SPHN|nr:hypothetical protein [Pelagerythrobacter aerophilus]RIV75741.1 hypothetical protein D2V04_15805 [Pelagerythrobacter aerophilus]